MHKHSLFIPVVLAVIIVSASLVAVYLKNSHETNPVTTTNGSPVTTPTESVNTSCQSSNLSAIFSQGDTAAGTYYSTLILENNGTLPCRYSGITRIELRDKNNKTLVSTQTETKTALVLEPTQTVSATIGFPNPSNYTSSTACQSGVTQLALFAPDQTDPMVVGNLEQLNQGWTNFACPGFSAQNFSSP